MLGKRTAIVILAIQLLSLAVELTKAQDYIKPGLSAEGREGINLSYDFDDKLDMLLESQIITEKTIKNLVAAVTKNQEDIESLRQMLDKDAYSLTAEVKNSHEKLKLHAMEIKCPNDRLPQNCYDVKECHTHVYSIMMQNSSQPSFPVACDLKTNDGGWTIIQRRQDGSVNFNRNWTDYVQGFGNVDGEYFIGLEKLHLLTAQGEPQELYIVLEDFEGSRRYAKYRTFKVDDSNSGYKLTVGRYSGDATDSLSRHSGRKFSTWDQDNDESETNCAQRKGGGWWYHACYHSHLNGEYLGGKISKSKIGRAISWHGFRGYDYSLKFVQMMIRPLQD